jgi:hypothetical protein
MEGNGKDRPAQAGLDFDRTESERAASELPPLRDLPPTDPQPIARPEDVPRVEPDRSHWLVRPANVRILAFVGIALLVASVLLELVFPPKHHFEVEHVFGFAAWFGFGTCLVMVVFAKLLGFVVKRKEGFYGD